MNQSCSKIEVGVLGWLDLIEWLLKLPCAPEKFPCLEIRHCFYTALVGPIDAAGIDCSWVAASHQGSPVPFATKRWSELPRIEEQNLEQGLYVFADTGTKKPFSQNWWLWAGRTCGECSLEQHFQF